MNELSKINAEHLRRCAIVYVRQSSTTQVEHNRESTARQYDLAERAASLGWRPDQVKVIDEDLGISGSGLSERTGFARMTAEVGLGQVGIVLGLEVSRLARNNADWYRLLDLCGLTHTLIGDGDGIYHPGLFNDRLVAVALCGERARRLREDVQGHESTRCLATNYLAACKARRTQGCSRLSRTGKRHTNSSACGCSGPLRPSQKNLRCSMTQHPSSGINQHRPRRCNPDR